MIITYLNHLIVGLGSPLTLHFISITSSAFSVWNEKFFTYFVNILLQNSEIRNKKFQYFTHKGLIELKWNLMGFKFDIYI